jgi:LmbE family N-acetylglucosaminyl deacetylase
MHLPDGNIKGQGFAATNFEGLARLENGGIKIANAVDGQSSYTDTELTSSLTSLMHVYQPTEIRTQSTYGGQRIPDHSDHNAVGRLATESYANYETQQFEGKVVVPLKYYMGYPIHDLPVNVSDAGLQAKMAAFFTYGQYDGGVCHSEQQCGSDPAYGFYLPRQYQNDD